MKTILKNWKTTLTGILLAIIAICKAFEVNLPYQEIIAVLTALGFTLSKDYNNNDNNPS